MSEENVEVVRRVFENAQTAYEHGHFQESLSVEAGLLDPDFELVPAAELTTEPLSRVRRVGEVHAELDRGLRSVVVRA
jgi:hypothetical protein